MIPRRTLQGIAVVGVLAAVSFWLNRDTAPEGPSVIAGLDTRLNYALQDFEGYYYDEQGRIAGKVTSPRLANDAETGIGQIEQPRFEVVHEGRRWTILSTLATVTPDRAHVVFSGPVDMFSREPGQGDEVTIRTSDVTLDIDPRMAYSDREITILEGPNSLNARGFQLDMTTDQFQLDQQVMGHYVLQ